MNVDVQAAKVYGEALFSAARDQGIVPAIREETAVLAEATAAVPRFRTLMEAPHIPTDDKVTIIERVIGDRMQPLLKNFILLLLRRNRVEVYRSALDEFNRLADKDLGISRASLTSARALDDEEKTRLQSALERQTGLKLTLDHKVDPVLIGGLVFECGDLMIDNSLKTQLSRLGDKLMAARVI